MSSTRRCRMACRVPRARHRLEDRECAQRGGAGIDLGAHAAKLSGNETDGSVFGLTGRRRTATVPRETIRRTPPPDADPGGRRVGDRPPWEARAIRRSVVSGQVRMTPSGAFVEALVAQGVTDVFGIVGSAFMDALELFPAGGIRFIPTVHERRAGRMADGFSRVSGRYGVCIAQNGPASPTSSPRSRQPTGRTARWSRSPRRPARWASGSAASRRPGSSQSSRRSPSTRRT